jgi:hypothetical protein
LILFSSPPTTSLAENNLQLPHIVKLKISALKYLSHSLRGRVPTIIVKSAGY